jgi:glycogen debranching enzyme
MEHSASSEQTDDPYHGGLGYRPSHNGEMYGNALAIANIAKLNSDSATAQEYEAKAEAIRKGMLEHLWDPQRKFFYHVYREDNPSLDLLDTREEIGFFPWRWAIPPVGVEEYEEAWEQLFDPQGFNTPFGPTTCEVRSKWYDGDQTSQCCWWNGNSWPYSTGHTLRALAAQVKRYRPTLYANADSYHGLLNQYARTQYKNGKPYVAECHSPTGDFWVCDAK